MYVKTNCYTSNAVFSIDSTTVPQSIFCHNCSQIQIWESSLRRLKRYLIIKASIPFFFAIYRMLKFLLVGSFFKVVLESVKLPKSVFKNQTGPIFHAQKPKNLQRLSWSDCSQLRNDQRSKAKDFPLTGYSVVWSCTCLIYPIVVIKLGTFSSVITNVIHG